MRKLTVDDIVDMRAYERERDELRRRIIDLKRRRRVALGPIMTIVFENTDTMRWQVQEMARAERMLRDEQIAHEVETYNQLIPDAGELSAHAVPRAHVRARRCASGCRGSSASSTTSRSCCPTGRRVVGAPSDEDEERLTRDDTTAAVHFLRFRFTPDAGRDVRERARCTSWSTIPSTTTDVLLDDRRSTPSSLADLARPHVAPVACNTSS